MTPRPMKYYLPRELANQILHQAQADHEREICGLLGGSATQASNCYPVSNIAESARDRFRMHPQQQIAALRQIRENGEQLFAIYHSHPHGPAAPSTIDIDEATYPEALTIIISLATPGVLEMKAFQIRQQQAVAVDMTIV